MAYLVTGGAGFIGSHVAERLLARGDEVVIFDNFNSYYDPALKHANIARLAPYKDGLTVVEADLRDAEAVSKTFQTHRITRVAHLAAMANVRSSINQTPLYVQINVNGTVNILEAARDAQSDNVVIASTGSVYGATQQIPFVETDSADRPLASYPATKRAAELMAHTYHNLNKMNVTILRFFNVYGPAGRPDMMPLRLMHASQDGSPIPVFNQGQMSRDWTYIEDTANGVVAALDRPLGYEIMNLGFGRPVLLTDFIETVEELSGRTINKDFQPAPASEPPITFCNNEKARRLLGFDPQTPVQDGLAKTWEWFARTYIRK